MTRLICLPVVLIAAVSCQSILAQTPQGGASATTSTAKPRQLTIHNKEWTGDFDKLLARRMILVYAPFWGSLLGVSESASAEFSFFIPSAPPLTYIFKLTGP